MNNNYLNFYNLLWVGQFLKFGNTQNKVFFGQTNAKNKHSKLKWIAKFAKI